MKKILFLSLLLFFSIANNAQEPVFHDQEIIASISYNGEFGRATLLMDLIDETVGIQNPLIVVEGFDPGGLISPEDVYGITDIENFSRVVESSGSGQLQGLLDVNQSYDIIYVNWDNGTDFIQRNAYALEAAITWINAEKADNNSTAQNVVWGQSMGGLVARYALKDMEDRNLPHETSLYISHDAPHLGANVPVGYQFLSRHALRQYVRSPFQYLGGEVILPLFTDGVTPLNFLSLQDTPAARQMLINFINDSYVVDNTVHATWQNELRLKGYPSTRNIAISNGNHCATPQNAGPGELLLSYHGNYSTGYLTDLMLSLSPGMNGLLFSNLAVFTLEPGILMGILPGGNKIKFDFDIFGLPSSGTKDVYKGKITYTKQLLFVVNININLTDVTKASPANTLPYDHYPGGLYDTGLRDSNKGNNGNFWQQLLFKYKVTQITEPTFSFVPTVSALDIGKGDVALNNAD